MARRRALAERVFDNLPGVRLPNVWAALTGLSVRMATIEVREMTEEERERAEEQLREHGEEVSFEVTFHKERRVMVPRPHDWRRMRLGGVELDSVWMCPRCDGLSGLVLHPNGNLYRTVVIAMDDGALLRLSIVADPNHCPGKET